MEKMWSDQLLRMLDIQYDYCKQSPKNKEQKGYYKGMKMMLERIVSSDYNKDFYIVRDSAGKHEIVNGENEYDTVIIVKHIEQIPS